MIKHTSISRIQVMFTDTGKPALSLFCMTRNGGPLFRTGLLLLMVSALLLPVYGPWLDADFAGKQPGHKHSYWGQADPYHHTEEWQAADHPHQARMHRACDELPGDGVANVYNGDAGGHHISAFHLSDGAGLSSVLDKRLEYIFGDELLFVERVFVILPDKPPRL